MALYPATKTALIFNKLESFRGSGAVLCYLHYQLGIRQTIIIMIMVKHYYDSVDASLWFKYAAQNDIARVAKLSLWPAPSYQI